MSKHSNVAIFVPHAGCPHRCSFCDQNAISGAQTLPTTAQVTKACERALETRKGDARDAQIAFFGGSFTAIPKEEQERLLDAAYRFVKTGDFAGIRLSTRPDCVDADVTAFLRRFGVQTVELGAQSMDDTVLLKNRRGHTAADVEKAAACIHAADMELGLQMMTGLYGDTDNGARETLRRLCDLTPSCLRIYPTQVLPNTYLATLWRQGDYQPPSLADAVSLCADLLDYAEGRRGIPVIRMGLHADASLQENRLAGPFHPAFRELCEGELYYRRAVEVLKTAATDTLYVNPAALSKMIGQHRHNMDRLARLGYNIQVKTDPAVPLFEVWRDIDRK